MKKIAVLTIIFLFYVMNVFSEEKIRIDRWHDFTVRISWSSKYTKGPDDTNWAKRKWPEGAISGTQYIYLVNPKNCFDKGQVAVDRIVYGSGYKYAYIVNVHTYYPDTGEWELTKSYYYYYYEENQSFQDFFKWANLFERYVQWDEEG